MKYQAKNSNRGKANKPTATEEANEARNNFSFARYSLHLKKTKLDIDVVIVNLKLKLDRLTWVRTR